MALDQTLIDQINAGATGTSGAGPTSGTPAGTPGIAGTGASETVNGDAFSDPSATLGLHPEVIGGSGGAGQNGAYGGDGSSVYTPIISGGVQIGSTTVYQPGGNGTGAGGGGLAGSATFAFTNDTIGSLATVYGGSVAIGAIVQGGAGGNGSNGGGGGWSGLNSDIDNNSIVGSKAGDGANGSDGAAGAAASGDISHVTAYMAADAQFSVDAGGGAGGLGGQGGAGGEGGDAGGNGAGGAGGAGGDATATITSNTLEADVSLTVDVSALGGIAGAGGGAGSGGAAKFGAAVDPTLTYRFADNSGGGNGGNGGAATAEITGNTLTANRVEISLVADPSAGGTGGLGGSESNFVSTATTEYVVPPDGATGATGSNAPALIDFSNNIVTVGAGAPGFVSSGTPSQLTLIMTIQSGSSNALTALDGTAGGNLQFSGNSFVGAGNSTLYLSVGGTGGGTINTANDTISLGGSPTNGLTGFSIFDLAKNDIFVAGAGNYIVSLNSDPDTIVVGPASGNVTLQGVLVSNLVLDFSGFGSALDSLGQVAADITQAGGTTTINLPGGHFVTLDSTTWTPSAGDVSFAAGCFAAGTRIAGTRGEVAVEDLRVGDSVALAGGGTAEAIWIGRREVDVRRHPEPAKVSPVRIAAGAFGPGRPHAELFLSPDHAVYVNEVLIPIRYLINGGTIMQVRVDRVTYYHIELLEHDVLLAEGLPVESFLDMRDGSNYANRPGPGRLYPDYAARIWEAFGCARLVVTGPELEAARALVAGFAAERKAA